MSLIDDVHREVTAMRGVLTSGLEVASGAHEHAGRIVAEANRRGFLGVGRRILGIQQRIATIRAALAEAANRLTGVRTLIGTVSGQPTPQQLLDVLIRARAGLAAVRDALTTTITQVTAEQQEIAAALSGAQPGPMLTRLARLRTVLSDVIRRCQAIDRQLAAALAQAQQAGTLGAGAGAPAPMSAREPAAVFDPTPYLDEMPKRLPRRPGQPRQKTHGRLIRSEGTAEQLLSGEFGADFDLARERAWEARVAPRPWAFDQASHIEIKVASRMHAAWRRTRQVQHETIVINNWPCSDDELDCDFVLDRFLPPGSTLTVYGPEGFVKTYRGRDVEP